MKALKTLFLNELADMNDAETRIANALPDVIKAATCERLQQILREHLEESLWHSQQVARVFRIFEEQPRIRRCQAIAGILEETTEFIAENNNPAINAAIICSIQKVEHYEIATYGALRMWAHLFENHAAEEILEKILDDEKRADQMLNELSALKNEEALHEVAAGSVA